MSCLKVLANLATLTSQLNGPSVFGSCSTQSHFSHHLRRSISSSTLFAIRKSACAGLRPLLKTCSKASLSARLSLRTTHLVDLFSIPAPYGLLKLYTCKIAGGWLQYRITKNDSCEIAFILQLSVNIPAVFCMRQSPFPILQLA